MIGITACHHADPKTISRLDSLLAVLDTTQKMADSIDFKKEATNSNQIKSDLEFIQNNFKDTLTREMGFALSDYKSIVADEGKGGDENYELMLLKELHYSHEQVLNLKHDFEKADMNAEDLKKYYNTESIAVGNLYRFVKEKQNEFKRKEELYNRLQPKISMFIDSIKNDKK